jgi:hypothetical protein
MTNTKTFMHEKVSTFNKRDDAWKFMYRCDEHGIKAGYPEQQKDGRWTVRWIRELVVAK